MRVAVNNAVAVSPRTGNGEVAVLADDGAGASVRTIRNGIIIRPSDFNPERIIIDDMIRTIPPVKVGDHFAAPLVGVLDYSFGSFKLLVTETPVVVPGSLSLEATVSANAGEFAIATFNVENLDPGDGATKFNALAGLIVNNLRAPDIIAVEEIQDNNGPTNDSVVDASATYNMLIAAIQTAGGPAYQARDVSPIDGRDGGEPGGNIRVGFLFRTDRGVSFVDRAGAGATSANSVVIEPGGPRLAFSPGRIDPTNAAFQNSRKPLAAEFSINGRTFFVIANHFNSKGGDQPLFGRFQPPTLGSEVQRRQQAEIVNNFVDQLLAADANANIVVLGDLNDFEFSAPVTALKGGVLNDLIETLPENERYTYVFDGNSQTLDHILVSNSIMGRPFSYDVVHVNSEFSERASDHDPQVVRLQMGEPDFGIGFSVPQVQAQRGITFTSSITINRFLGFSGSVTVQRPATQAPGISVTPASRVTTGGAVNFNVRIHNNAAPGQRQLLFTGRDQSGRIRSATLLVDVP